MIIGILLVGALIASVAALITQSPLAGHRAATAPTATASATITVPTTPTENVQIEQELFSDSLLSNAQSWITNDHCFFRSDGYHIKGTYDCYAPVSPMWLNRSDTTVDVKLAGVSGDNAYGLLLRIGPSASGAGDRFYAFDIDSYGEWSFQRCDGTCVFLVPYNTPSNSAADTIHPGVGVRNTMRVLALGSHFDFYINGVHVGYADDSAYLEGQTGLGVTGDCEAVFTNIIINQIN